MKKGDLCKGTVVEVLFPNRGYVNPETIVDKDISEEDKKTRVLVKGPLIPGQKVKFRIKKSRKEKCTGILLGIESRSQLETKSEEDLCPHFGKCGGCTYLSMEYEKQLELKKNQIKKIFENVIKSDKTYDEIYEGIYGSPNMYAYRNKMEYTFGDEYKGGPLALGLHKRNSFYDIVDMKDCKIVHEDFIKIIEIVREYAKENNIEFYNKITHEGVLRYLVIRRSESSKEVMVALVTSSQRDYNYIKLSEILQKKINNLSGFIHIISDKVSDTVSCDKMDVLYGRDYIYEEILGLKFKISLFSFFQTNTLGAETLYSKAREYIDEGMGGKVPKTVYDLYSGTGTIAQMMADVSKKVIGVEIVEDAVIAARENAILNKLTNCEFIAGDVLKCLDDIEEKPDYIILDPPREGVNPKALKKIIDYGVESIVYISCKPTSLAEDLDILQESGYEVVRMCNVDMFPWTVHVESVVKLTRAGL